MPTTHELKIWPEPFTAVYTGRKAFEIRSEADRTFAVGDTLHLREFKPLAQEYTGRDVLVRVMYLVRGPDWGVPEGMVVMSILQL